MIIPSTSPFHYSKAKRPVGIQQSRARPVANTGGESRSPPLGSQSWVRQGWSLTVIIQKSRWEKKSVLRCPGNDPRRSAKTAAARSHTPLGFLCVCTRVHLAVASRFSSVHTITLKEDGHPRLRMTWPSLGQRQHDYTSLHLSMIKTLLISMV